MTATAIPYVRTTVADRALGFARSNRPERLEPLDEPTLTAAPVAARNEFGPIFVKSVLVTTLVLFLGVGVPMWALTGQVWDGIGLGAFTAFWGGPGFGLMAAGALWTARNEHG